jgi:hypothetical protein
VAKTARTAGTANLNASIQITGRGLLSPSMTNQPETKKARRNVNTKTKTVVRDGTRVPRKVLKVYQRIYSVESIYDSKIISTAYSCAANFNYTTKNIIIRTQANSRG